MNELESRILQEAKEIIDSFDLSKFNEIESDEVHIPFGMPINTLVYSKSKARFTRIEYTVGVGECLVSLMGGGYYAETEERTINL